VFTDGKTVYFYEDYDVLVDTLKQGQTVLRIAVQDLIAEVQARLTDQQWEQGGSILSQLQDMAADGFEPILNIVNVGLNGGLDNESMDGYSEPATPILRGLVWDYHQKTRRESMRKRRRGLRHGKR
jgi:hypothetical protein